MGWITSWPSVIFGCAGLTACVVGLLIETFARDQPQHLCTRLRRVKEKAANRAGTRKSGRR